MERGLREFVQVRAGDRCEYCRIAQADIPFVRFHVEHIVPRKHGGSDAEDNLALACERCNLSKGPNLTGIDPLTGQVIQLFDPRRETWAEHFQVDDAYILGTTPTGRATAQVMCFNDPRRVRLRAGLGYRG